MSWVSANNSSTQPLMASGTFTGLADISNGYLGMIVTCKTDADGMLYVDFSQDGTNWDRTVTYIVQASNPELHRLTLITSYVRVRFVNGSTAQSYFRLQTILGDFIEPSIALNALSVQPDSGTVLTRSAILGWPFLNNIRSNVASQLSVANNHRLAGQAFNGTSLDTNYYSTTIANSATVTVGLGAARLRTNTTANASIILNSVKYARFIAGRPNNWGGTIALSHTGTANNVSEWGVGTDTDRFVFRLSGTTLSCVIRSNGTDIYDVPVSSWNSNRTAPTLTVTNFYEIHYNSLFAYFIINGVVMHIITTQQQEITTGLIQQLNLPIRISNVNSSSSTSDVSIYASGLVVLGSGGVNDTPIYKNITSATTTLCKSSTGVLKRITLNTAANGTIKLYDAVTATNIFSSIAVSSSDLPITWEFDLQFNTGLTIVTSAATDITVIYE